MTSSATCTDVKTATDILTEYHLDPHRDDDETRWRGDVTTGDFRMWKQALRSRNVESVQHILDNHSDSPELSCTYNHPWNESRWWYGANFVMNQSFEHEVIVEIGAGSHARVAQQVLLKKPTKCYIICDLVSPLLVAYHNISKPINTLQNLVKAIQTYSNLSKPKPVKYNIYITIIKRLWLCVSSW